MKKTSNKKLNRVILALAIGSFIITFLEGLIVYNVEDCHNQVFRFIKIIQNSIRAFGFQSDISVDDALASVDVAKNAYQVILGYLYAFATFTAPYCTLTAFYKLIEKLLRVNFLNNRKKDWERVVIFGYNEEVHALIDSQDDKEAKRKIHLVAAEVPEKQEREYLDKGVVIHKENFMKASDKQLEKMADEMELSIAKYIVLYDKSTANNFALYNMFQAKKAQFNLHEDVKFFCRCEDESIKHIVEDYYDTQVRACKAQHIKMAYDLELINIPEMKIRKMLEKNPFHAYYESKEVKPEDQHIHLMIVGFGKLGQALLMKAMNLGVLSSKNRILIDVVDANMDEKKRIFANAFNEDYVVLEENEFYIPSDKADGEFRIRFHDMDIRYKEFSRILRDYGNPEKDGIYTYMAVCLRDQDASLHCMSEIERYLRRCKVPEADKNVSIAVRMNSDSQVATYLNNNEQTHKNVFVIEEKSSIITLADLLRNDIDMEAKEFHKLYSEITIGTDNPGVIEIPDWRELEMFQRNSNRALAYHSVVKDFVLKNQDFNEVTKLLKKDGSHWSYIDSEEEFIKKQCDTENYPLVSELSRMEHRRWCYFMASCGWRRTEDPNARKNLIEKENPCLCTWDDLVEYKPYMCCYDLMPLLMKIK